jgi:16S rRNA (cytosine967-C5)-methyltransferase
MNTRHLAVRSLTRIFGSPERPKDVLDDLDADLDERERSFLMELVYGVLRHRDYLDWLLSGFLKRPSGLPDETINNLRTAVYQLSFTRVPEWAAVDEAVNIGKRKGGNAALVNAVLRSYLRQRQKADTLLHVDEPGKISIMTSHPGWLVRRWVARLGIEEAGMLAKRNNEIPLLTLRIDGDRGEALRLLADAGIDAIATGYSHAGIIIKGREKEASENSAVCVETASDEAGSAEYRRVPLRHIPLDRSSFVVQDEAAQLISWLLDPQPGERVLDACAAPGGKATHIARLMKDEGEVVAVDIDPGRAEKITENISRLGLRSVQVVTGNLGQGIVDGSFDRVLLDAPCSSIGVIRKNPDVKYRHTEADLRRFGVLQLDLLKSAAGYIKKGGIMVYSVCSTEPEEGEDVVRAFLQSHTNFSIIEGVYDFLGQFAFRDGEGHLFYRTWPHKVGQRFEAGYGMDGFFAARIKRD